MSDPFIGQIIMWGLNFAPRGFVFCNGQLLQIAQNSAMFSLLGTQFGGDGRTTFGVPNLVGRSPMHNGNGPGLTPRTIGALGGAATHSLTSSELPSHSHGAAFHAQAGEGDSNDPSQRVPATEKSMMPYANGPDTTTLAPGAVTLANSGSGQAHNNMQPYLAINFCIAVTGNYPSRA